MLTLFLLIPAVKEFLTGLVNEFILPGFLSVAPAFNSWP